MRTPEQIAAERYPRLTWESDTSTIISMDWTDGIEAGARQRERAAFVAGWMERERAAGADAEKLYGFLQIRDDFICAHGLWHEFMERM